MVTVYEKPECTQCEMTQKVLVSKGVPFRTESLEDPENVRKVKEMGYMSAPVVVTPEGDSWAGFRPDKIGALVA